MYSALKKRFSLFVIFVFLFTQCVPAYAGKTKGASAGSSKTQKGSWLSGAGNLDRKMDEMAKDAGPAYWVERGAQLAEATCNDLKCVRGFLAKAEEKKDPSKEIVCIPKDRHSQETVCLNAVTFAQGALSNAIKNKWLYWKGEAVAEESGDVSALVTQWGVYDERDRKALLKYFHDVVNKGDCNTPWYRGIYQAVVTNAGTTKSRLDQRKKVEERSKLCAYEVGATIGIAFLAGKGQGTADEKAKARNAIYTLLKKSYDTADGITVLKGSVTALMLLNTNGAWDDLNKFLTSDSLPSAAGDLLELVSVKGLTEKTIHLFAADLNNSTRYYNRTNSHLSYIDSSTARSYGYKYPYEYPSIQYPYANAMEEIGFAIGQRATYNQRAKQIAQAHMTRAKNWVDSRSNKVANATGRGKYKSFSYHWPVIVGIMDGYRSHGDKYRYAAPVEVVFFLRNGDFWDVNEGTQRRIRQKAYESLKLRGTFTNIKTPTKDNAKWKRYENIQKSQFAAELVDMGMLVAAAPAFVEAVPAMARGIAGAVKLLGSRQAWIGAKSWIKTLPQASKTVAKGNSSQTVAKGAKQSASRSGASTQVQQGRASAARGGAAGKSRNTAGIEVVSTKKAPAGKAASSRASGTARSSQQATGATQTAAKPVADTRTAAQRLTNSSAPRPDVAPRMPGATLKTGDGIEVVGVRTKSGLTIRRPSSAPAASASKAGSTAGKGPMIQVDRIGNTNTAKVWRIGSDGKPYSQVETFRSPKDIVKADKEATQNLHNIQAAQQQANAASVQSGRVADQASATAQSQGAQGISRSPRETFSGDPAHHSPVVKPTSSPASASTAASPATAGGKVPGQRLTASAAVEPRPATIGETTLGDGSVLEGAPAKPVSQPRATGPSKPTNPTNPTSPKTATKPVSEPAAKPTAEGKPVHEASKPTAEAPKPTVETPKPEPKPEVKPKEQAPKSSTKASKAVETPRQAETPTVKGETVPDSGVTLDNLLEVKPVNGFYEVKVVEDGKVVTKRISSAQYRALRDTARSRGTIVKNIADKNKLNFNRQQRAARGGAAETPTSTQPTLSAQQARELETSVSSVKRSSQSADRFLGNGRTSVQVVRDAEMGSSVTARAEKLATELEKLGQEMDDLYIQADKARKVGDLATATRLSEQVGGIVERMETLSSSLRQMEAMAEGTKVTRLVGRAETAVKETQTALKAAKAAGVPAQKMEKLAKALENVVNKSSQASSAAKTAKTVEVADQIGVSQAIDEATFAGRQLEQALANLNEELNFFKQWWGIK